MRFWVVFIGVLWSSLGGAQDARELFEAGSRALGEERFDDAVRDLSGSFALSPRPSTAANLALALREAGRVLESIAQFDQLLDGQLGELSTEMRTRLQSEREAARSLVARIELVGRVNATHVVIDDDEGFELSAGETATREIDPGTHTIRASVEGYRPFELRVRLNAGDREEVALDVRPEHITTQLEIRALNPSDDVEIVGVGRAQGRLQREVEPGVYRVRVIGPHGATEQTVTIDEGDRRDIALASPEGRERRAGLWVGVVVGVLAVAGGITAAVLATRDRRNVADPPIDPRFGTIQALHSW